MNRKAHVIGAILYTVLALFVAEVVKLGMYMNIYHLKFYAFFEAVWGDIGFALFCVLIVASIIGGKLPDIIDRPTNPNHRKYAHAKVLLIFLTVFFSLTMYAYILTDGIYYFFIFSFIGGYISHLMLDASTPMGLP